MNVPKLVYNSNLNLFNLVPKKSDPDNIRIYINETRAILFELKNFGVDLLDENSSGYLFFSTGLFSKLSSEFQLEISSKSGTEYPTLNQ